MKVFTMGTLNEFNIGDKFLVARCGYGHTIFGEYATLTKITNTQLVFTTESGTIVKSKIDVLKTIGKAAKNGYFISDKIDGRDNLIKSTVSYWNDKKCCMEYK